MFPIIQSLGSFKHFAMSSQNHPKTNKPFLVWIDQSSQEHEVSRCMIVQLGSYLILVPEKIDDTQSFSGKGK